jgi:hypothetical protein
VAEATGAAGIEVLRASDLAQFHAALELLRQRRQSQVFVLAGDGTIHAIAQFLAQLPPGEWSPQLLLLGGGRANLVPRDAGGWPPLRSLQAALAALKTGRPIPVEQIRLLRVEQEGSLAQHGFMLAGAMVDAGIRICREHRASGTGWRHRSWLADPIALLNLGFQVMSGNSPLEAYSTMSVTMDTGPRLRAPLRALLASTLQCRGGMYNPFAARGAGALRVTAIATYARRFWRRLPALMTGHFSAAMNIEQGFLSGRCESVEVLGLAGYSLDGEAFDIDPMRPVRLSPGISVAVLRP